MQRAEGLATVVNGEMQITKSKMQDAKFFGGDVKGMKS